MSDDHRLKRTHSLWDGIHTELWQTTASLC